MPNLPNSPDRSALSQSLQRLLDSEFERGYFSGVVLISDDSGGDIFRARGLANRSWNVPNRRDTRFRIASVGKTHTAVAALQLIERGALSLDVPIVELLGLRDTKIPESVTLYHLLTMTSGIADWIDESETSRWNWDSLKRNHPLYFLRESADYLRLFADREPIFPPGQGWAYCNANFVLLGMAIEKASGVPYMDYMRRHVFAPAGMPDTDFLPADAAADRVAEGYVPILDADRTLTGWKSNIYDLTIEGGADGGSTSTADDLIGFSRALRSGDLLNPDLVAEMTAPRVEMPFSPRFGYRWWYGYGVEVLTDMDGAVLRWGHGGEEAGASARWHHYPNIGIDAAILSNATESAAPLSLPICDILTGH